MQTMGKELGEIAGGDGYSRVVLLRGYRCDQLSNGLLLTAGCYRIG